MVAIFLLRENMSRNCNFAYIYEKLWQCSETMDTHGRKKRRIPRTGMAGETLSVAYVPKRVTDNDDDDDRLKYGHRNRQSLIKLTKTGRNTQNGANLP